MVSGPVGIIRVPPVGKAVLSYDVLSMWSIRMFGWTVSGVVGLPIDRSVIGERVEARLGNRASIPSNSSMPTPPWRLIPVVWFSAVSAAESVARARRGDRVGQHEPVEDDRLDPLLGLPAC